MILNFVIQAFIMIASMAYQRRRQKKMQRQMEAEAEKRKGLDVVVDGEAINLPLVYGYQKVAGVRAVVHVADNGEIRPLPSGFIDREVNLTTGVQTGEKKEYMLIQQAFCYGGIDEVIDIEVDGRNWDDGEFWHHIRYSMDGGAKDPTAKKFGYNKGETNLFSNMFWANMVFKLNRDDPNYGNTPEVLMYVKGTKIRDIVFQNGAWKFTNTYSFSNNPALVIADYLTRPVNKGGCGIPDSDVHLESFGKAKGVCDIQVAANAKVRGRVNGVRPVKDGETEPAPNNRIVRLYECNHTIDTSKPRRDVIDELLETMAQSELVYSEGQYKLVLDYPSTVEQQDALITATYTDDDILGKVEVANAGADERYNHAVIKFRNESLDYATDSVSWPVRGSTAHTQYLNEDNNVPNETTYTLVGGTHRKLAFAKAEEIVRSSRIGKTIKFSIPNYGMKHEVGDIFKLNSVAGKITNELFRITGIRVSPTDLSVSIEADRFDKDTLAFNVDDDYVEDAVVIPGTVVPNVTNLQWTKGQRRVNRPANGYLTWTNPTTTDVRRLHIWAKKPADSDWEKIGQTSRQFFDIPADFNVAGHDYQFLVKTENSSGYLSQGAQVLADAMPNLVAVNNVTKQVGVNTVTLKWSNANPELVGAYKVYYGTSNVRSAAQLFGTTTDIEMVVSPLVPATYYLWIDAYGEDGSVAAMNTPISVSKLELSLKSGDLTANTVDWSHLAIDVKNDMEGYVASANASMLAANTFMHVANTHAQAANTSKNEAGVFATAAGNSASAAATSATQASASANSSAQSAAASANSALTANTHAGTAKTYRDEAATSASNAAGSSSSAATQAGIAVTAKNSAIDNTANPFFEFGKEGWEKISGSESWDDVTTENGPTAGKAISIPDDLWASTVRQIPVDTSRTYKVRIRVKAVGGSSRIYAGVMTYDINGNVQSGGAGTHRYCAASGVYVPADGNWHEYSGTITGEGDTHSNFRAGTASVKPMFIVNYSGSSSTKTLVDYCYIEDISESTAAAGSASAASTSAYNASASATSAGQSASAATSAKTAAETAKSQAETFKNQAATSASNAAGSASAAGVIEGTVTRLLGSENFPNPVFKDWGSTYPKGMGGVTETNKTLSFNKTNGGKYYGYVQFNVNATSGTHNRPYLETASTFTDGLSGIPDDATKVEGIRILAEVEKLSGGWGGACLRVSWRPKGTGGTWGSVYYYLGDNLGTKNNQVQTVEFDAFKPASFVPGSDGSEIRVYAFGSSTYGGHSVQTVQWRLHRLSVRSITKGASTYIQQKALSDIQGNMAASVALRATANTANASLELVALNDAATGTSASQARIAADQILLDGSVKVPQLKIDQSLVIDDASGAFVLGKTSTSDFVNDGIYLGRDHANDGSVGFGFFAGRTAAGQNQYIRITKDDGLEIQNAIFKIGTSTYNETTFNNSTSYNLPAGSTTISLTIVGGGGGGQSGENAYGGGSRPGSAGQETKVILRDGTTNIKTWTSAGGAGAPHNGRAQLTSQSPSGDGGRGGAGGRDRGDRGRDGTPGEGAVVKNVSYDVSGLSNPNLVITVGNGGAGGSGANFSGSDSGEKGYPGQKGVVKINTSGDALLDAGPVSFIPNKSGSWAYTNTNNWVNLPSKSGARGAYYLFSNVPAGAEFDNRDGTVFKATHWGQFGFFTKLRPQFKHTGSVTMNYYVFPLG